MTSKEVNSFSSKCTNTVDAALRIVTATKSILRDPESVSDPSISSPTSKKQIGYLTKMSLIVSQVEQILEAELEAERQYSLSTGAGPAEISTERTTTGAPLRGGTGFSVADRRKLVRNASSVVSRTIEVYTNSSLEKLSSAEPQLRRFEGLPVDFDILSLMQIDRNEGIFCRLLAWLLDPTESHGVGDAFLRLFIARLGISSHGRLFNYSRDLEAGVFSEVSWDVPKNEPFERFEESDEENVSSARSRKLRVDILVLIQGYVIPIEVKVYAKESHYLFRDSDWKQGALYGKMWQLMLDAQRDSTRPNSEYTSSSTYWFQSLRQCLGSRPQIAERIHCFDGGRASVVPVLIHPRDRCVNQNQPIGEREGEHNMRVRHMRWLDIDRMLYHLSIERDLQAGRLDLIRSFRTTILRLASGTDLMELVENLRLRIAEPALTRRFPLESEKTLEVAVSSLNHVDVCCRDQNKN